MTNCRIADSRLKRAMLPLILIAAVLASVLPIPIMNNIPTASAASWLEGWGQRLKISIDHDKVDGNLAYFPVTIFINSSAGKNNEDVTCVFDELGSDWQKIAVTRSDGLTQMYVEKELWDDTAEEGILHTSLSGWVVDSAADTVIYLYYDSGHTDNTAYVGGTPGSSPATNVWDSNYASVYHFNESPGGGAPQILDSTPHNGDGACDASMGAGDRQDGAIGYSTHFDGVDDDIELGNESNFDFDRLDPYTLECWVNSDAAHDLVLSKTVNAAPFTGYELFLDTGDIVLHHKHDNAPADRITVRSTSTVSAAVWTSVAASYDGSGAAAGVELYKNGADAGENIGDNSLTGSTLDNDPLTIGDRSGGGAANPFGGLIDELRISSTERSADWVKASYYSTADDFVDFDIESIRPIVDTTAATLVDLTGARLNGSITNVGGNSSTCNYRGFVWDTTSRSDPGNTTPSATAYATSGDGGSAASSGSFGTGAFSYDAYGLDSTTTYYYRACAHNSHGWAYGDEVSFATASVLPTVDTLTPNDVTYEDATLNGDITDVGNDTYCDYRAFIWSTSAVSDPGNVTPSSWDDSSTRWYWQSSVGNYSTGTFLYAITGLEGSETYYYRAAAHNDHGWRYGDQVSFGTVVGWLDGYEYRKRIDLTGVAGAGTDYQVLLTIDADSGGSGDFHLEGHCYDFPNDIVFTDNDEETVIGHATITENLGASPKSITVRVRVGDSLETDTYVFCYYGDSLEANRENWADTFISGEDFSFKFTPSYTQIHDTVNVPGVGVFMCTRYGEIATGYYGDQGSGGYIMKYDYDGTETVKHLNESGKRVDRVMGGCYAFGYLWWAALDSPTRGADYASLVRMDPDDMSYVVFDPGPTAKRGCAVAADDNYVYIVGVEDFTSPRYGWIGMFDPATSAWVSGSPFHQSTYYNYYWCITALGKLWVTGDTTESIATGQGVLVEFNPSTHTQVGHSTGSTSYNQIHHLAFDGTDIWLTFGILAHPKEYGRWDVSDNSFDLYTLPSTAKNSPTYLAEYDDVRDKLWLTTFHRSNDATYDELYEINKNTGAATFTCYTIPDPHGICIDDFGRIWLGSYYYPVGTSVQGQIVPTDPSADIDLYYSNSGSGSSVSQLNNNSSILLQESAAYDAAIIVTDNALPSSLEFAAYCESKTGSGTSVHNFLLSIAQKSSQFSPLAYTEESGYSYRRVHIRQDGGTGNIEISYFNSLGSLVFWNGSSWVGASSTAYAGSINVYYRCTIDSDGTDFIITLYDSDWVQLTQTSSVAWADTYDTGTSYWAFTGDPYTNATHGMSYVSQFYVRKNISVEPSFSSVGDEVEAVEPPVTPTEPDPPSNFSASAGTDSVGLSWTVASGANSTYIRFTTGTGVCPTTVASGSELGNYTSPTAYAAHSSLAVGTEYCYSAWSWSSSGGYSTSYSCACATTNLPSVLTMSATETTTTSTKLQGSVEAMGGNITTVYVYFQYGLTTSYGTNTAEQTKTAVGGFSQTVSDLEETTTYHFRAVLRYNVGEFVYGADRTVTTSTPGAPTVVTGVAANVAVTSATLQGTLSSLGDYSTVSVYFQYGATLAYGTSTTAESRTSVGAFSYNVASLESGTEYHFRAVASYGTTPSYIYGSDATFTTQVAPPSAPSNFQVTAYTTDSITLSWFKSPDAQYTHIYFSCSSGCSYSSCPTSRSYGTLAVSSTGTTFTHSGLTPGVSYCYTAWSENNGIFSAAYAGPVSATTTEGLSTPDNLDIVSALIFEDFASDDNGDMLTVYMYEASWYDGGSYSIPAVNASDYFDFKLTDQDDVLKAQKKMKSWGYRPGSIYLSSSLPKDTYTLVIDGVDDSWGEVPPSSDDYDIDATAWEGNDWDRLSEWVLLMSQRMEGSAYYSTGSIISYSYGTGSPILTDYGAQLWLAAIPGIDARCPDLFFPRMTLPDMSPGSGEMPYADQLYDRGNITHGDVWTLFEDTGEVFGVEATMVAGMFWFMLYVAGVMMLIRVTNGNIGASLGVGFLILLVGSAFGGIHMAYPIGAIAAVAIYAVYVKVIQPS